MIRVADAESVDAAVEEDFAADDNCFGQVVAEAAEYTGEKPLEPQASPRAFAVLEKSPSEPKSRTVLVPQMPVAAPIRSRIHARSLRQHQRAD